MARYGGGVLVFQFQLALEAEPRAPVWSNRPVPLAPAAAKIMSAPWAYMLAASDFATSGAFQAAGVVPVYCAGRIVTFEVLPPWAIR